MRAVVQRVLSASVTVDGQVISSIGKGLVVLVGIDRYDNPTDSAFIIKKVVGAKLFDDNGTMWKRSVKDIDGEVLCVSQFTLFANFKGLKPDFHESMSTIPGKAFYTTFLDEIRAAYQPDRIKDGQFGAMMQVSLVNDGPVTVTFDSREKTSKSNSGTSTPLSDSTAALSLSEGGDQGSKSQLSGKQARQAEYEARAAAKARARDTVVGQLPHQSMASAIGDRAGLLPLSGEGEESGEPGSTSTV